MEQTLLKAQAQATSSWNPHPNSRTLATNEVGSPHPKVYSKGPQFEEFDPRQPKTSNASSQLAKKRVLSYKKFQQSSSEKRLHYITAFFAWSFKWCMAKLETIASKEPISGSGRLKSCLTIVTRELPANRCLACKSIGSEKSSATPSAWGLLRSTSESNLPSPVPKCKLFGYESGSSLRGHVLLQLGGAVYLPLTNRLMRDLQFAIHFSYSETLFSF